MIRDETVNDKPLGFTAFHPTYHSDRSLPDSSPDSSMEAGNPAATVPQTTGDRQPNARRWQLGRLSNATANAAKLRRNLKLDGAEGDALPLGWAIEGICLLRALVLRLRILILALSGFDRVLVR